MDSAADTGTSVFSSLCRSEVNNSKSYLTLVGEVWNAGNQCYSIMEFITNC